MVCRLDSVEGASLTDAPGNALKRSRDLEWCGELEDRFAVGVADPGREERLNFSCEILDLYNRICRL